MNSDVEPTSRLVSSYAFAKKTCHEQDSPMVPVDKRHTVKALEVL